ncbi:phosphoribosylanthranilate isomerase [Thiohalocapsa marina]|uniref:N-(5'-phosphoribosyl)anthranilate isomerase n=1 Tax=Thiohalocapsa marina TaxID=424902 RepID=A0A5M8FT98_9GAMM|nr:phosphoribosylanthranilate isomerase [Thiohalocapsa marina]KAA6187009.1 phosphoribosylanthranilate isomerase [Thiohalocapsa marina]
MNRRTRVKICGLTREQDVADAVALGADAIGLVFHAPSPRAVSVELAAALTATVPAFVTVVGLFVDAEAERVREVLRRVPLGALQFHGREEPTYCAAFGHPWIKALAMRDGIDAMAEARRYGGAASLLLDTFDPRVAGGTGRRFDWDLIPAALAGRIILAGGLDAGNVAAAVARVQPHAVDVSGGVESARGIKDRLKIAEFMQGVRNGDQTRSND